MTDEEQDERIRPAVILGSGFSKAISDAMPTMPELGVNVLARLGLDPEVLAPFGGNLEQWMSYLSIDQPWLSPADNYDNRAQFARVSEAVNACILEAEAATVSAQEIPIWLLRLAWTWCDQRARVFSFNYDTLLERAIGTTNRVATLGDVYVAALSNRHALDEGSTFAPGPALGRLLSLYKLHGSTSWGFGGLDGPPNDRIILWTRQLRWMLPMPTEEDSAQRYATLYDDLVPLIVPPTLTKGPFFSNLTLRAQWRRAAEALGAAQRLTVIGYSFPAADLVAQQWVGTTFRGDRMDVIDRAPERPASIRATVANSRKGRDLTGDSAIQDYVDRECGDHVAWRIWSEGDATGARAELFVNGTNVLVDVDPSNPPWKGTEFGDVQLWIHKVVEKAGGDNPVNRAQGELSYGSIESRQVVLRPGKRIKV